MPVKVRWSFLGSGEYKVFGSGEYKVFQTPFSSKISRQPNTNHAVQTSRKGAKRGSLVKILRNINILQHKRLIEFQLG